MENEKWKMKNGKCSVPTESTTIFKAEHRICQNEK